MPLKKFLHHLGNLIEWPFSGPQRHLAESRQSYSRDAFVAYFSERGLPEDIAVETWKALMAERMVPEFTPKPEDDLGKVFRLMYEDKDDVILEILKRCNCRIPPPSETDKMEPVETVSDIVEFVAKFRA